EPRILGAGGRLVSSHVLRTVMRHPIGFCRSFSRADRERADAFHSAQLYDVFFLNNLTDVLCCFALTDDGFQLARLRGHTEHVGGAGVKEVGQVKNNDQQSPRNQSSLAPRADGRCRRSRSVRDRDPSFVAKGKGLPDMDGAWKVVMRYRDDPGDQSEY